MLTQSRRMLSFSRAGTAIQPVKLIPGRIPARSGLFSPVRFQDCHGRRRPITYRNELCKNDLNPTASPRMMSGRTEFAGDGLPGDTPLFLLGRYAPDTS